MARTSSVRWSALAFAVFAALVASMVLATRFVSLNGPSDLARGGPAAEANPEAAEQGEAVEAHQESFEQAVAQGKAGTAVKVMTAPAAGWAGELLVDAASDDWEPAIAADPNAPYVYLLTTRYASTKPCPGNCPTPYISLQVSPDGGASWGPSKPLCACKGSGQFDPIIEVVAGTAANSTAAGNVYGVYMNGFNIMFVKSTDHGGSWSAPAKVYGNVSWNDKPILATSDDGRDIYITFNGPTGGDPYVSQSHDYGAHWAVTKLANNDRYYFAFDSDVASDGTVYLGESAILYGGGGNKGTTPTGTIDEHVFVSTNGGASWTDRPVASVFPGLAATSAASPPDYYLGHHALAVDAAGTVVMLYDGATAAGGLQTIAAKRSTNKGVSWSSAVTLSDPTGEATDPTIEAGAAGDVRAFYMQTTGSNVDQWNVYYVRSTNGGVSWGSPVRISDATSGPAYVTAAGFLEPYGDYGEMAITNLGKTVATWGEGNSYSGPGGVWFNREP